MIMNLQRTAVASATAITVLLTAGSTFAQPDSANVQRGRPAGPAVRASSPVTLNFVNAGHRGRGPAPSASC